MDAPAATPSRADASGERSPDVKNNDSGREINSLTKIDETTGLAAVPEDMFWRVKEATVNAGDTSLNVGGVSLNLIRKKTMELDERKLHEWKANGFFKRLITGEKQSKVVTEVRPAESLVKEILEIQNFLVEVETAIPEGEEDQWTSFEYRVHYLYSGNYREKKHYKVTEATPENLRKRSIEAWEAYLNAEHADALEEDRKVNLNRILGDYPPKSLKDLVDA